MHNQVVIIGGGPSGTLLALILAKANIDVLVLERMTKEYVLSRIRAGVLEWNTVDMLMKNGVGKRMSAEGQVHEGTFLSSSNKQFRIDFKNTINKQVMVYGQTEVTFDLYKELEKHKVKIIHEVDDVEIKDLKTSKTDILEADIVLVAVGRRPNTDNLGLEKIGVKVDKRGFVETDDKFKTSVDNIYAIGDVIKGPMLAHKAEEDGVALVELINNEAGHVDYNLVPNIIYTAPEVASIGKTEDDLKQEEISYKKGVFPFTANSRAKAIGHTEGFVKILSDKETDKILGAHIIGHEAGTIIHELSVAMGFGASSEDVARICHGHPTVNEAIKEAALATFSKAIHS